MHKLEWCSPCQRYYKDLRTLDFGAKDNLDLRVLVVKECDSLVNEVGGEVKC